MANTADVTAVNGDMVLAVRDFSHRTASTLLNSNPLLAILGIRAGMKPDEIYGVGDPKADTVINGARLTSAKIREIMQVGQYSPLIESVRQHDQKWKAWRDTQATASAHSGGDATFTLTIVNGTITAVAVSGGGTGYTGSVPTLVPVDATGSCGWGAELTATVASGVITAVTVVNGGSGYAASGVSILIYAGNSEGERYSRPVFKWAELQSTGRVYQRDIDSVVALNAQGTETEKAESAFSVVSDALLRETANNAQEIAAKMWTGAPSDQTQTIYDQPFGVLAAIDDGGTTANYAGVDRSMAANYWWRAKVDASVRVSGFKDAVDDANLIKGLAFKGGKVDVFVVHPSLHAKWKSEAVAYSQNVNIQDELRQLGKWGFKSEVIQYGDTYAIPDWRCPKGTALGLNSESFVIAFMNGKKFTPTKLYDQRGIDGGIDGHIFYVNTQIMPMCIAPSLNIKYTNMT